MVADPKTQGKKIEIVETIRGLAALAVCLFHFTKTNLIFTGSSKYYQAIFTWGWLGVEAFFVLSGFIIVYSLIKSDYTIQKFFKFFTKRCVRIEPPYLISVLLVLILGWLSARSPDYQGREFRLNPLQLVSHIAYAPEYFGCKWLLPVYWSLEAEFHYYILIGLTLPLLWKNQFTLLSGFFIGLLLSYFVPLHVFSYMPLFIMGIAAAALRLDKINLTYFFGVLFSCVAVSLHRGQLPAMPVVGLFTSLAMVWAAYSNPITEFLGKISFSLYLVHVPVGGRVLNYASRFADSDWKVWVSLLVAIIVTIITSWVFYRLVEYPCQYLSKKIRYRQ